MGPQGMKGGHFVTTRLRTLVRSKATACSTSKRTGTQTRLRVRTRITLAAEMPLHLKLFHVLYPIAGTRPTCTSAHTTNNVPWQQAPLTTDHQKTGRPWHCSGSWGGGTRKQQVYGQHVDVTNLTHPIVECEQDGHSSQARQEGRGKLGETRVSMTSLQLSLGDVAQD